MAAKVLLPVSPRYLDFFIPIFDICLEFNAGAKSHGQNLTVTRKQFLLCPTGVKSFYKAKGDMTDKLVVDFACRRARAGVHYVGLNRVANLSNLYIRNFSESKIKTSDKVVSEMDRLRRQPIKDFLYNFPCTTFKVLFHNVQITSSTYK